MKIRFSKYEGTGNDFILVDNRTAALEPKPEWIRRLCHRRFGIGADGLMLLNKSREADFDMLYFNADGLPGSMCGNGGRCIALFARHLGIIGEQAAFTAVDGRHVARIGSYDESARSGHVTLGMAAVSPFEIREDHAVLDTGSPHYVSFVADARTVDVVAQGRAIRNSAPYRDKGINVNFISRDDGALVIRTYERGVEDETLSCGTGAVAAALAARQHGWISASPARLEAMGGRLEVRFSPGENGYEGISLKGPAHFVYEGTVSSQYAGTVLRTEK